MNRALRSLGLVAVFSLLPASQGSAELVLVAWSHTLRASDADGQHSERFSYVSHVLPFTGSLLAEYREIRTDGDFATSFDGNQLTSVQQVGHSALQTTQAVGDELWSHAVSAFRLTSEMDMEVTFGGSLTYDLFGEGSSVAIIFGVLNDNQDPIHNTSVDNSFAPSPATVELTDTLVLPGGASYFLEVTSDLIVPAHRFAPPLSTASSDITLTVTAIPEPTSLVLLGFGSWLICFRRRSGFSGVPAQARRHASIQD